MMRVTFHELAKRELADAVHFYKDKARSHALLEQVRRVVIESDIIRVLAVAHHRREPTYWLKRT